MAWEAGAGARAPEKALDDMRSALRRVRGEIEKLKTSAARLLDLPSFGEDANNPVLSDLISAAWHLQAAQGRLEMP